MSLRIYRLPVLNSVLIYEYLQLVRNDLKILITANFSIFLPLPIYYYSRTVLKLLTQGFARGICEHLTSN